MKTISLAAIVACFLLSSCGSDSPQEVYVAKDSLGHVIPFNAVTAKPTPEAPKAVQPTVTQQLTPAQQQIQQQQSIQAQIQQQIQQQQAKMAASQPVVTAKGMNPPHGQPGHRCDIPVGAPLNSKPVVTQTQATPVTTTTTAQPTVVTAPGMNPPHGQPGHRCDIAVGAPLNSKPLPPVTATPAVTTTQLPATATAAKKDSGQ